MLRFFAAHSSFILSDSSNLCLMCVPIYIYIYNLLSCRMKLSFRVFVFVCVCLVQRESSKVNLWRKQRIRWRCVRCAFTWIYWMRRSQFRCAGFGRCHQWWRFALTQCVEIEIGMPSRVFAKLWSIENEMHWKLCSQKIRLEMEERIQMQITWDDRYA